MTTMFCSANFHLNITRESLLSGNSFFDFKSIDGQKLFFIDTNQTTNLSSSFENSKDFESSCKSFYKNLNKKFYKCFNKIRVKKGGYHQIGNNLIQVRINAKRKINDMITNINCPVALNMLRRFLENIERELTIILNNMNAYRVRQYLDLCLNDSGRLDHTGFWKFKKIFSLQ